MDRKGERALAATLLFIAGLRVFLKLGLTVGYALSFLMLPVILGSLRDYRGARLVMLTGMLAVVSGLFLDPWSAGDHVESFGVGIRAVLLLLGTLLEAGVMLWARGFMSISAIGSWYGLGLVANVLIANNATLKSNAWKFGWAVPLAVLILSQVLRYRRRSLDLVALITLGTLSIVFDSRSYFASFLLAAILVVWQMRPRVLGRRARWGWTAAMMGGLGYAMYTLMSELLVSGYLGSAAQARSVAQINLSGSLLLGGRPELAATLALIKHVVWGFGPGVLANSGDILVAKSGLASIHYDPNNGYVEQYMLGSTGIELHSLAGDLWAAYGFAGLIFLAVVVGSVVRNLAEAVARREASGLLIFLSWWTLWNAFFSPIYSSAPTLAIVLGIGLRARGSPTQRDASVGSPASTPTSG